jgi:hypothetical protein
MSLNENQKRLYNLHLQTFKRHQNKPFQKRLNFDDFESEKPEDYLWLQKLDNLLTSHPQINQKLYFEAPYRIYEDQDYFNLNYYTSQAGIRAYILLLKEMDDQSPDNDFQIEFIRDSLEFIKQYCIENKIELSKYLQHIESITYVWAVHLAEHKISPFVIIGFKYFNIPVYDYIFSMPEDERNMLIGEFAINFKIYEKRLNESKKAKRLITEGIKIISQKINHCLQSKECLVN